jgi:hypothetical protein
MPSKRTYWLDLFTYSTWQQFLNAGASVTGFRDRRWTTVKRIRPGDYLLCYLTGVSRWIGLLEATSEGFLDHAPLWAEALFPARVKVKLIVVLTPETAVPVFELRNQLSVFRNLQNPNAWTGHFRGSPTRWKSSDGEAVAAALLAAKSNPVKRPVDLKKLQKMPPVLESKMGPVTVPSGEYDEDKDAHADDKEEVFDAQRGASVHTEMQWLLLKLGSDMGLDVWVARNDKNKGFEANRFARLPRLRHNLPLQFDEVTNRTIELIDVLWLKGNAIAAAFGIESTTSIYCGLLRMSDLVAMQPNLKIPLYLVAPEERRSKVMAEVNRPTFNRLAPPLSQICRYIPFEDLKNKMHDAQPFLRYLRPDFLQEISESCVVGDS